MITAIEKIKSTISEYDRYTLIKMLVSNFKCNYDEMAHKNSMQLRKRFLVEAEKVLKGDKK